MEDKEKVRLVQSCSEAVEDWIEILNANMNDENSTYYLDNVKRVLPLSLNNEPDIYRQEELFRIQNEIVSSLTLHNILTMGMEAYDFLIEDKNFSLLMMVYKKMRLLYLCNLLNLIFKDAPSNSMRTNALPYNFCYISNLYDWESSNSEVAKDYVGKYFLDIKDTFIAMVRSTVSLEYSNYQKLEINENSEQKFSFLPDDINTMRKLIQVSLLLSSDSLGFVLFTKENQNFMDNLDFEKIVEFKNSNVPIKSLEDLDSQVDELMKTANNPPETLSGNQLKEKFLLKLKKMKVKLKKRARKRRLAKDLKEKSILLKQEIKCILSESKLPISSESLKMETDVDVVPDFEIVKKQDVKTVKKNMGKKPSEYGTNNVNQNAKKLGTSKIGGKNREKCVSSKDNKPKNANKKHRKEMIKRKVTKKSDDRQKKQAKPLPKAIESPISKESKPAKKAICKDAKRKKEIMKIVRKKANKNSKIKESGEGKKVQRAKSLNKVKDTPVCKKSKPTEKTIFKDEKRTNKSDKVVKQKDKKISKKKESDEVLKVRRTKSLPQKVKDVHARKKSKSAEKIIPKDAEMITKSDQIVDQKNGKKSKFNESGEVQKVQRTKSPLQMVRDAPVFKQPTPDGKIIPEDAEIITGSDQIVDQKNDKKSKINESGEDQKVQRTKSLLQKVKDAPVCKESNSAEMIIPKNAEIITKSDQIVDQKNDKKSKINESGEVQKVQRTKSPLQMVRDAPDFKEPKPAGKIIPEDAEIITESDQTVDEKNYKKSQIKESGDDQKLQKTKSMIKESCDNQKIQKTKSKIKKSSDNQKVQKMKSPLMKVIIGSAYKEPVKKIVFKNEEVAKEINKIVEQKNDKITKIVESNDDQKVQKKKSLLQKVIPIDAKKTNKSKKKVKQKTDKKFKGSDVDQKVQKIKSKLQKFIDAPVCKESKPAKKTIPIDAKKTNKSKKYVKQKTNKKSQIKESGKGQKAQKKKSLLKNTQLSQSIHIKTKNAKKSYSEEQKKLIKKFGHKTEISKSSLSKKKLKGRKPMLRKKFEKKVSEVKVSHPHPICTADYIQRLKNKLKSADSKNMVEKILRNISVPTKTTVPIKLESKKRSENNVVRSIFRLPTIKASKTKINHPEKKIKQKEDAKSKEPCDGDLLFARKGILNVFMAILENRKKSESLKKNRNQIQIGSTKNQATKNKKNSTLKQTKSEKFQTKKASNRKRSKNLKLVSKMPKKPLNDSVPIKNRPNSGKFPTKKAPMRKRSKNLNDSVPLENRLKNEKFLTKKASLRKRSKNLNDSVPLENRPKNEKFLTKKVSLRKRSKNLNDSVPLENQPKNEKILTNRAPKKQRSKNFKPDSKIPKKPLNYSVPIEIRVGMKNQSKSARIKNKTTKMGLMNSLKKPFTEKSQHWVRDRIKLEDQKLIVKADTKVPIKSILKKSSKFMVKQNSNDSLIMPRSTPQKRLGNNEQQRSLRVVNSGNSARKDHKKKPKNSKLEKLQKCKLQENGEVMTHSQGVRKLNKKRKRKVENKIKKLTDGSFNLSEFDEEDKELKNLQLWKAKYLAEKKKKNEAKSIEKEFQQNLMELIEKGVLINPNKTKSCEIPKRLRMEGQVIIHPSDLFKYGLEVFNKPSYPITHPEVMISQSEESSQTINQWVRKETNILLEKLDLKPNSLFSNAINDHIFNNLNAMCKTGTDKYIKGKHLNKILNDIKKLVKNREKMVKWIKTKIKPLKKSDASLLILVIDQTHLALDQRFIIDGKLNLLKDEELEEIVKKLEVLIDFRKLMMKKLKSKIPESIEQYQHKYKYIVLCLTTAKIIANNAEEFETRSKRLMKRDELKIIIEDTKMLLEIKEMMVKELKNMIFPLLELVELKSDPELFSSVMIRMNKALDQKFKANIHNLLKVDQFEKIVGYIRELVKNRECMAHAIKKELSLHYEQHQVEPDISISTSAPSGIVQALDEELKRSARNIIKEEELEEIVKDVKELIEKEQCIV